MLRVFHWHGIAHAHGFAAQKARILSLQCSLSVAKKKKYWIFEFDDKVSVRYVGKRQRNCCTFS